MKSRKTAKKKPAAKPAAKALAAAAPAVAVSSDLPAGVLSLEVVQFRSLGSILPLQASITGWTGFKTPPDVPMPEPAPTLALKGNDIVVSSKYPVKLIFNLPDKRYLLVGAAWESSGEDSVGEQTFPAVAIERGANTPEPYQPSVPGGSSVTITNFAQIKGAFEYALQIQDTSTADIGLFDPGMTNDPPQ